MNSPEPEQTVLIVDDKPERIRFLSELLKGQCKLMAAKNGQEALNLVSRRKPDLILLDVVMPKMNGYEACKELQGDPETSDIPIIFITAKDEVEDEAYGLELGAVDYISEPLNASVVERRVQTHLKLKKNREHLAEERKRLRDAHSKLSSALDRINHDIEVAAEIQESMLPGDRSNPFPDSISLATRYEPEQEVGGDFFDYKALDDHRLGLILADVCGHGLDAAFVTGVIKTSFVCVGETLLSPEDFMNRLNDLLIRYTPLASFATVVYSVYDCETKTLTYANGGHCPFPVRVPPGREAGPISETSSLVLGATESISVQSETFSLQTSEKLLMTTDGITETERDGPGGEQFGYPRLLDVATRYAESEPDELVSALYDEVCQFRGSGPQTDDLAILSLGVK